MSGEVFAVIAAFGFASNYVIARRGLEKGTAIGGILLSTASATVVLTIGALAASGVGTALWSSVGLFIGVGILASGLGGWASIAGVGSLGPSTSVPVETGTRPIVAVTIAALALGETVNVRQIGGIAAIVAGGYVLSKALVREAPVDETNGSSAIRLRQSKRALMLLPACAGASYAAGDVISKVALDGVSEPLFGAAINLASAFAFWIMMAGTVPAIRQRVGFGSKYPFLIGGIGLGVGILALYQALERSDVSIVAAIIGTQPLIVFALSTLMLRDLEQIRRMTLAAGLLIIAGTILVVS